MKDPRVYVVHMLECIRKIQDYTRGGREEFLRNSLVQDAVVRNFEIRGEAAKRVPDAFRQAHPSIAWKRVAGFRDILIHDYEVARG